MKKKEIKTNVLWLQILFVNPRIAPVLYRDKIRCCLWVCNFKYSNCPWLVMTDPGKNSLGGPAVSQHCAPCLAPMDGCSGHPASAGLAAF